MKKTETKFVDLPDLKIAYREFGAGKNLILLHGNSESKSLFTKYQTEVFADYHTFAIDSRGHGESRSEDEEYSLLQYSDDIIAFCNKLGIRETYVLGYSDGGNIALLLGKKDPITFSRIVAVSPNYLVSGLTDESLRLIYNARRFFIWLGKIGFKTKKMLMRIELMLKDIGLSKTDLRNIQSEIIILYAEKDMIRESHILEMGNEIPGAKVKKIQKSSHLSILYKKEAQRCMKEWYGKRP